MLSKILSLLFAACAITTILCTPYNITVTDQSPTIKYTPSRHGDPAQTWNVTYDNNDWYDYEPGAIREGPSVHWTYFIGATATFGCKGTAIYVWGSAQEGEVSITVGGEDISNTRKGDYLAWKSGMKDQWWDVVLKVKGSSGVYLNFVGCTIDLGNDGSVKACPW